MIQASDDKRHQPDTDDQLWARLMKGCVDKMQKTFPSCIGGNGSKNELPTPDQQDSQNNDSAYETDKTHIQGHIEEEVFQLGFDCNYLLNAPGILNSGIKDVRFRFTQTDLLHAPSKPRQHLIQRIPLHRLSARFLNQLD